MVLMEALERSGMDIDATLRRFGGNAALLERFIRKFPQDGTFEKLEAAVEGGRAEEIEALAHTLKGTSANLGFQELSDRCAALVNAVRAGRGAEAPELFSGVAGEHGRLMALLREIE